MKHKRIATFQGHILNDRGRGRFTCPTLKFSLKTPILSLVLTVFTLLIAFGAQAGGTWSPVLPSPPTGVNNCILLSDGTVLGMDGSGDCCRLTPDIHGSYLNGTWSQLAAMNNGRLFFSSQLLTNGDLWVAGGEDGPGGSHSEVYDPLNNVWTEVPDPNPDPNFADSISEILPDGNPLVCPVYSSTVCLIYNVATNGWQTAAPVHASQDEADWVKLPDDNILTIDAFSQNSEHYVPSLNEWITDGTVPVPLFDSSLGELGNGHLLPNGTVFYIGSTTNTAIYTPGATATNAGSWVAGPTMVFGTNQLGASDAPAAMMVNGKILCCLGPSATYNGPSSFYEYDYTVNAFTQVTAPGGGSTLGNTAPFGTSMLDLPDGTVLFMDGQNAGSLYIYTPDGTPLAAGQPVINTITQNSDGSYHLTGTGLNGISEGAAYGDDEQMNTDYPLVRMTNNATGYIYYARTYNWNSTSVMTSNRVLTTEFVVPQNLPAGTYSLVVTANGNPSAATTFTYSPPAAPTGLTADSGSNAFVSLQWNASSGAIAYDVKRASSSGGYFATIATVSGTTYTNAGLTNGLTYYYEVAAVGSSGVSANSGYVSATPVGPPPIPTGLTATSGADAIVPLIWNASYGATNYNLKRSTIYGGPYTTIASMDGTNYTDTGLANGTTYYYVVTAVGPNGESQDSTQTSATPLAPLVVTWFKADAIAGLTNGASLAVWTDSSSHGYFATQLTAGERPMYVTNAINGLPVVHFISSSNTCLTFNRPVQDNFTIFCVFRSTQGLGSGTLYYQGAGLVNGEVAGVVNDFGTALFANGQVCAGTGNPDVAVDSAAGFNDGNPHLLTFKRIRNVGEVDLYMDGIYVGTTTGSTGSLTAPTKLALGEVQTGINFLTGDIGEVKIYNSALSDSDRIGQESALIQKWGVTLPAAPGGLSATPANGQVLLNWNAYPTATNYLVMRSTTDGGPYGTIGSTSATNYVDATVINGTTYYYVVSAMTPNSITTNSSQASATPLAPSTTTWFRADAIAGLANGGTVSSWSDSSGNGFTATQANTGQRPNYIIDAMNSLPVVRFNSAKNSYLSFSRPVQDDWTMIIAFQSTQNNQGTGTSFWNGAGLVNGDQSGTANDFGTQLNANGQVTVGTGNPDTSISSSHGYNDGHPHVATFQRIEGTGAFTLYVDGTQVAAGSGNSNSLTAPATLDLGAVPSGGGFLSGDISEVMIFDTALSDANRTAAEIGLECKYGISGAISPLAVPTSLNGVWGNRQISLTWLGISGASAYSVSSSTNANGPFNLLASVTTPSYVDTTATVGQTNYYEVTATRACNSGPTSTPVAVFLPTPQIGITYSGGNTVAIAWPSWASDWNLYSTTNLTPPINWVPVTNNSMAGGTNQLIVNLPVDSDSTFFRLAAP